MQTTTHSAHEIIRVGGSALPDGVMMLTSLACAIAREDAAGVVRVQTFPLPQRRPRLIDKLPFIRVLPQLVRQMWLVVRGWKTERGRAALWPLLGLVLTILLLSSSINVLLIDVPDQWYPAADSALQLGLVVALICVTRAVPRWGRIWRFHGAEHQAVAAYEANLELTVGNTSACTLYHPRCGTNLAALALLLMMPGLALASLMPGIAGYLVTAVVPLAAMCTAFEIVMLGQNHLRVVLWPGLAFQRLTVARPGPAESRAGIMALEAVLEAHDAIVRTRQPAAVTPAYPAG